MADSELTGKSTRERAQRLRAWQSMAPGMSAFFQKDIGDELSGLLGPTKPAAPAPAGGGAAVTLAAKDTPAPPKSGLYYLCMACTWFMLAINFIEFLGAKSIGSETPNVVYFLVLGAYAADREMGKWAQPQQGEHPTNGHLFVWAWAIFALTAPALAHWFPHFHVPGTMYHLHLHEPQSLRAIAVEVVGVMLGTKASKYYRGKAADVTTKILQELASGVQLSAAQLEDKTHESEKKVERALKILVKAGKVIRIGKGPNDPDTRYRLE